MDEILIEIWDTEIRIPWKLVHPSLTARNQFPVCSKPFYRDERAKKHKARAAEMGWAMRRRVRRVQPVRRAGVRPAPIQAPPGAGQLNERQPFDGPQANQANIDWEVQ